jgi:hypothetical protein
MGVPMGVVVGVVVMGVIMVMMPALVRIVFRHGRCAFAARMKFASL